MANYICKILVVTDADVCSVSRISLSILTQIQVFIYDYFLDRKR